MAFDAYLLVFYVLLALGVSFVCSIAEAVLLSITPSYVEDLASRSPRRGALVKRLKQEQIDHSLAAILSLNTIAHTVGAIGAGAQATVVFGSAWFGVFSVVMTLLILFLSEIVPKTIGAVYWANLVMPVAYFMRMLIVGLFPVVWLCEKLTKTISRGKRVHVFSRDEFIAMARLGRQTGELEANEALIIRNLLRFSSLRVVDVMTPRIVITAFAEDMKVSEAVEAVKGVSFSRLPIYRGDMDNVTGFVLRDDVLLAAGRDGDGEKLSNLKREIGTFLETTSLSRALEILLKERQHIAIVVNEYGGTCGVVTLEDLIETLVGIEIVDELDTVEDMRELARKKWSERARALGISGVFEQAGAESEMLAEQRAVSTEDKTGARTNS